MRAMCFSRFFGAFEVRPPSLGSGLPNIADGIKLYDETIYDTYTSIWEVFGLSLKLTPTRALILALICTARDHRQRRVVA